MFFTRGSFCQVVAICVTDKKLPGLRSYYLVSEFKYNQTKHKKRGEKYV